MFAVMSLNKEISVTVAGSIPSLDSKIKMCWADGMIGAIPVFETREAAEKYANGKEVIELVGESK